MPRCAKRKIFEFSETLKARCFEAFPVKAPLWSRGSAIAVPLLCRSRIGEFRNRLAQALERRRSQICVLAALQFHRWPALSLLSQQQTSQNKGPVFPPALAH
jgi:hypothetical protein